MTCGVTRCEAGQAKRLFNTLTGILAAGAIMVTSSGIPGVSNEPITEMTTVVSAAEAVKFNWCEPCLNMKITSGYGYRKLNGQTEFHTGMDVVSTTSDLNLYSVGDGEVVMAEENSKVNESCCNRKSKQYGFCNYIAIKLNDGSLVIYGHLCPGTMLVKKGDKVTAGQPIACMGRTGSSTAVHTHIELRSAKYSSVKGGIYKFYGKKYTLNPMPTSKGGCVKFSKKPSPVNDTALTNNAKYIMSFIRFLAATAVISLPMP